MSQSIFLCDRMWNISRVLHQSTQYTVYEGDNLKDLTPDAKELEPAEDFASARQSIVFLRIDGRDEATPTVVYTYPSYFLVVLAFLEDTKDFKAFMDCCIRSLTWADENLKAPYENDFYRLQVLNNQLVNQERALMKTNQRLSRLLTDVRSANDTIALLERDELTEFYWRSPFLKRADERMQAAPDRWFDMITLDLTRFRLVNELFGRKEGDRMLTQLAMFLVGLDTENVGLFARASSTTFYMLMPSEKEFYKTLEIELPHFFENYPLPNHVQSHMGVAKRDPAEGLTAEQLSDRARIALETVKKQGEATVVFYDCPLKKELYRNHQLLDLAPEAVKSGQFRMYLQPKVDMGDGHVVGAEALIRWVHPKLGLIPPMQFIPLLEEEGLIYEVDQYIWRKAAEMLHERKRLGRPARPISVNVARNDLYRKDLVDVFKNILAAYQIEAPLLHLEVLERSYVKDSSAILPVLKELRDLGFVVEMDDFGTGESSLAMLADMPVDILKLDRAFLLKALADKRHTEVIRGIVHMAKVLDLGIIAEGVENEEQRKLLLSLGCHFAQGFYYGRPEPADFFLEVK